MKENTNGNGYLMFDKKSTESWCRFEIQGKRLSVDSAFEPSLNLKNMKTLRSFLDIFIAELERS